MPEKHRISERVIEDEMKDAYMAYAMSVIVGRALPDARDGLKPVHKRILYSMHDQGMRHNQAYKKSARIVGDVLGKYHPHGDTAIYDTLVRMAQDFALRYPLIDGQGNFGSIDGDNPAAMRYTEAKLQKISQLLLQDLEKETVDWQENFDGSLKEPQVLPSVLPNLLVNGSQGIAVGMATNMPPHNLTESCNAAIAYLKNPDITVEELLQIIPGPDFPTGGVIQGKSGIHRAYRTGKGRIRLRGVIERETVGDKERLVITEIPYQVVKADLVIQIADLVRSKKIEEIRDIRDESDRKGMRVVIELKQGANPDVVENSLFKYTRLQLTFGVINLALVDRQPRVLTLPELLKTYLGHRKDVITKRTQFDLKKAEERAHILEGLRIALKNIDDVIPLIKKSNDTTAAREALMEEYELSEKQASAILEMRLQKLTSLETESINKEYDTLTALIVDLKDILEKPERVKNIIIDELEEVKEQYGDERRTHIAEAEEADIDVEDLIDNEDMVVTVSHRGYTKRLAIDTYQAQKRGGVGIIGAKTKEDDFVEHLFVANTHSYLLFFTNKGRVHWKKVYHIPESSRTAKGSHINNLIQLAKDEKISAVIPVAEFSPDRYLVFATKNGMVKKTSLQAYSRPRQGGIHAIKLNDGDDLVTVVRTDGESELLLASAMGQAVRFSEKDARPMGRFTAGVTGMRLRASDEVIGLELAEKGKAVLTVTENGYGKRTPIDEYRLQHRGGFGVRNIQTTARNGHATAVRIVQGSDDLLLISQNGIIIRTHATEISKIGRNTQGVRVIKLRSGDKLSAVAKVVAE